MTKRQRLGSATSTSAELLSFAVKSARETQIHAASARGRGGTWHDPESTSVTRDTPLTLRFLNADELEARLVELDGSIQAPDRAFAAIPILAG